MRTKATTLVFLLCFLSFSPLLPRAAGGAQKPAVGMQSAERARRILSLLRNMKSAAVMYYADETGSILDDPERFRERVNRDPLACRNLLGEYLNYLMDSPPALDETYHLYVLEDGQWLVGFDLTDEDDATLGMLDEMAKQSGRELIILDRSAMKGGLVICMKFNMKVW
ncbi:hypothetical protein [uncultured Fretibacterium sp.]|uniref:hypothetical protein n=1 Tax=uncultured Fretibacterium sp. TaxID=1678694 RepID=UPI00325F99EB